MSYDTSKSGINAAGSKADATIRDAKAGSPLGSSGTYSDAGNAANPDQGTIASNETNTHRGESSTSGSTSDTGRKSP
jgi:hypothetical protein